MERNHVSMSPAELQSLMEGAITAAFVKIGISADNPIEMQHDMAFIRSLRTGAQTIRTHGMIAGMGLLLSALATVIGLGLRAMLSEHK